MVAAITVPLALSGIALIDGAFAGFRAATGRSGMINKRVYYIVAARRGFLAAATMLGLVAAVLLTDLVFAARPSVCYASLVRAGSGLLVVIGPFAAVVIVSLIGYTTLPRRPATFLILLGLGPLTLLRPLIVVVACAVGVWLAHDIDAALGVIQAGIGVLAVEPFVHRRWYADVTE